MNDRGNDFFRESESMRCPPVPRQSDRAAAALANAAAAIPQLELQIATTENQINVLLGRNLASSVDLAKERCLNGKSSYYEVLQAQQELYPTQRAQVQTRADELISVVQLYRALGGGWTQPESQAAAAAVK